MSLGLAVGRAEARRQEKEQEKAREARDRSFRSKVSLQQFMNHNGPLFRHFASAGVDIDDVVEGDRLKKAAEAAMKLATLVAADLAGKEASEVTPSEARPFRTDAAEWVAARLQAGAKLDVERAAAEIAAAVRLADSSWDSDAYKDDGLTDDASLMITAATVAGTLARQVEIYDFRLGRDEALSRLVTAVAERASRTAREMLGPEAEAGDVRNLTQTLARNLSALMEACYDRTSRETVARLVGRPEAEKAKWLEDNDPFSGIIESFREWSVCFAGFAVAATREMTAARPAEPEAKP